MTATANIPARAHELENRNLFALWSGDYDDSPNPMLSLEERFLTPLLPGISGRDVLDVGCGTGRWLARLADSNPLSLSGIDFSPEMLARARQKLAGRACLAVGSATALPVADSSADIVFASFVASYIGNLDIFAAELRRSVRAGGTIFVSDVHPQTAAACNWKRGFRTRGKHFGAVIQPHSLEDLRACFRRAGLEIACLLEPPFGLAELETFRRAGKMDAFYGAAGLPAIYILQLQPDIREADTPANTSGAAAFRLCTGRVALNARTAIAVDVEIQGGRVRSLASSRPALREHSVDLDGYLLLPGLINAHDHLEFGLYPNLGRGPYVSCSEWSSDIQRNDRASIARQQSVPLDVRLWWGALRNLLCGVTTVCHHNPLHAELLKDDYPVRVVTNYGWAHSLAMDQRVREKFQATPDQWPFVLHACEGTDDASASEIFELEKQGVLNDRTILVHGLALTSEGIELLNRRAAALVWCPSSNQFLFGVTHTRRRLASVQRLLIGSDSPLTAKGGLLDEVQIAHRQIGIPVDEVYRMLFERAAAVFRLHDGEGKIRPDTAGDVIAVRDLGLSPAETLANLTAADIELVIVRGRVQLASEEILPRLAADASVGLHPIEVDSVVRWIRAPLAHLFREAERVLGPEIKLGGKRVQHVSTAWL